MGHRGGGSFDKETGFDFTQTEDRRRCWRELEAQLLQELNYSKMEFSKAVMKVAEGVEHSKFAMQLFAWQHLRGKAAVFEHPSTSRAWQEDAVQEVLSMEGVRRVRADQCQYMDCK